MDSNGHRLNDITVTGMDVVPMPEPERKRKRVKQAVQAGKLQSIAYEATISLTDSCRDPVSGRLTMDAATAVCVHKLIGAWDTAADRLRILRGKGLPASVKAKAGKTGATTIQPL